MVMKLRNKSYDLSSSCKYAIIKKLAPFVYYSTNNYEDFISSLKKTESEKPKAIPLLITKRVFFPYSIKTFRLSEPRNLVLMNQIMSRNDRIIGLVADLNQRPVNIASSAKRPEEALLRLKNSSNSDKFFNFAHTRQENGKAGGRGWEWPSLNVHWGGYSIGTLAMIKSVTKIPSQSATTFSDCYEVVAVCLESRIRLVNPQRSYIGTWESSFEKYLGEDELEWVSPPKNQGIPSASHTSHTEFIDYQYREFSAKLKKCIELWANSQTTNHDLDLINNNFYSVNGKKHFLLSPNEAIPTSLQDYNKRIFQLLSIIRSPVDKLQKLLTTTTLGARLELAHSILDEILEKHSASFNKSFSQHLKVSTNSSSSGSNSSKNVNSKPTKQKNSF